MITTLHAQSQCGVALGIFQPLYGQGSHTQSKLRSNLTRWSIEYYSYIAVFDVQFNFILTANLLNDYTNKK